MKRSFLARLTAGSILATGASAQQSFLVIAAESFDYPPGNLGGLNGGSGWETAWDAGAGGNNAVVSAPGLDLSGNKASINIDFALAFRTPSSQGLESLLDGEVFGADGTTIWISFDVVRGIGVAGGYGGLSIFDEVGFERLFMGSPWLTHEWGIQLYPTGVVMTVPGTDVNVPARLVYRLDFQPGDDRLRMWVDPLVPHPDTAAAIDTPIPGVRFKRIRLGSGGAAGAELYDFDGILIETPSTVGTPYCFGDGSGSPCPCGNVGGSDQGCANSTGMGATAITVGTASVAADDLGFAAIHLVPMQPALLFVGDNAVNNGNGVLFGDGLRCAGGNVVRLGVMNADAAGDASWGPNLGATGGWNPGDLKRFQVWYRDPSSGPCGSGFNLSHGVEVTFTP